MDMPLYTGQQDEVSLNQLGKDQGLIPDRAAISSEILKSN